jgi:hypothetical protein
MAKCTDSDLAALNASGPLLRFAAENVKNLDPDLPLAVAEAHAAAANDSWDPKISQRFWGAFARLCDLIHPVTMDCLYAAEPTIDPPRWRRYFGGEKRSVAARSSGRYLGLLWILLGSILPIQLYVWTCSNLSKKIDDLFMLEKTKYATLAQDYIKLDAETRGGNAASWTAEQKARAFRISADSGLIHDDLDRIATEARFLEIISTVFVNWKEQTVAARPGDSADWFKWYQSVADRISQMQSTVLHIQEKANLIVGVLGAYILPILFGAIGAVAYVIRTISEQIKTTTFAMNSPTRHIMRAALGGMVGLVIGLFGDLSTKFSLSPLALAFLAGYGVEAVFSMFDALIEKFKTAKAAA